MPAVTHRRRRFSVGRWPSRPEWLWFGAVVAAYLLVAGLMHDNGPFGYDESVYALRARAFHEGMPATLWSSYRAPGLPWVAQVAWWFGDPEPAMRLVTAAFMVGMIGLTWVLGRALAGPRAGLLAAAGLASTPFLLRASVQVWPDVPGAALGLAAVAVLVFATGGDRPSWWVLLIVPLAVGATYVRFGAPIQLTTALGAVGLWRLPVIRRGPVPVVLAAVGSAVAVYAVLTIPALTGTGTSALSGIGFREWFEGFVDYPRLRLSGELVGASGLLLLSGLAVAGVAAWRRDVDRGLVAAFLGGGLATVAATALVLHGELRYLSPAWPLLWIAAAVGIGLVVDAVPAGYVPAIGIALVVNLLVAGLHETREIGLFANRNYRSIAEASEAIAEHAAGRSCAVFTGYRPHVAWYSECATGRLDRAEVSFSPVLLQDHEIEYVMYVQEGTRQPDAAVWEEYLAVLGDPVIRVAGSRPVEVYVVPTG
jgi:hypothetical protein